jgi:pimeloyl-ACP methyl ester carboxylesterase
MASAGVTPGQEPVMLSGHSQGGLLAAALAATPRFRRRFRVTHVVAAGAPIGRAAVPASVRVLALEHRRDPVPRLDQRPDPDRPRWVTVHRDLGVEVDEAWEAHDSRRYTGTARHVDRSHDASLRHWRRHSARFLAGEQARAWDYRLERTIRSATVERSIR